ncbi:MAG: HNH endonuclease [Nitrososphaeraceae archaeon]|nr:HNH endonuclease [Nitrososphaeraceae archaeon]
MSSSPISTFKQLKHYVETMVMKANYQPVVIKFLLQNGGSANRVDIADELKRYNLSDSEKDYRYVEVFRVLERNNVVSKVDNIISLNITGFSNDQINKLISICEGKITQYQTTIDISNNNIESIDNRNYATRMKRYLERRFNMDINELEDNTLQILSSGTIIHVKISSDKHRWYGLNTNTYDRFMNLSQNVYLALSLAGPEKTFILPREYIIKIFDSNAARLRTHSKSKRWMIRIKENSNGYQLSIDHIPELFEINQNLNYWKQIPDFKDRKIDLSEIDEKSIEKAIKNNDRELISEVFTGENTISIKQRRGQNTIRKTVLKQYLGKCALCDIADKDMLIASHIIPWSVDKQLRGILENLICLCRFHDALFENKKITISDDYGVSFSDYFLELSKKSKCYAAMKELTNRYLRLPVSNRPQIELLQRHREQ